jgi:predicted transporter
MGLGAALIALGLGAWFSTKMEHITALIPAFFGIVFLVLGALARSDRYRMHAMHAAASLALLGAIMAGFRAIPGLLKLSNPATTDAPVSRTAVASTTIMCVLCALFVLACIRSFMAARRARG